ncbi:hypothetical protein RUM44_011576 [Polyplax serrata]|uniref:Uncharacterized protein n=1 Tax=Polyplax serrata TaxID=468196 RepID=A0ABR1AQG3_POLSC
MNRKEEGSLRNGSDLNLGCDVLYTQCFSGSDYQSQYEEECPVNYSLKYSETEPCKGNNKSDPAGTKFKEFAESSEADLDQPTDFSLKYGEKTSPYECIYFPRAEQEDSTNERPPEQYASEEQTPLMFSRCSSLTSLSSFDHITQSIPDDRSSIVSDFSRTTSGVISPSELPDSPTQTAPSSPKRNKLVCFPVQREKKSVFEDDVATYKQEDTPIEFSRATSLSSLNIDNPVKQDFNLKTNSKASSVTGGDDTKKESSSYMATERILNVQTDAKPEVPVIKVETKVETEDSSSSAADVDDILTEGLNNIRLDEPEDDLEVPISGHILPPPSPPPERSQIIGPIGGQVEFSVKAKIPPIFSNTSYEASDDDVHTYHTEGTPANISHAGSHSDLSTLSLISGIPPSGTENNSDDSFYSESEEALLTECDQIEISEVVEEEDEVDGFKSIDEQGVEDLFPKSCTPLEEALVEQCIRLGMPQKTHTRKLERENNSFKSLDERPLENWFSKACTPLEEALVEQCIRLGMPQKSKKSEGNNPKRGNQVVLPERKNLEQPREYVQSKSVSTRTMFNNVKPPPFTARGISYKSHTPPPPYTAYPVQLTARTQSATSLNSDCWFPEACTPLEEALVEQCIRLGRPHKSIVKPVESKPASVVEEAKKTRTTKSKINNDQTEKEKEQSKKSERFVINSARRLVGRRKKARETCKRCKKCREKNKGII